MIEGEEKNSTTTHNANESQPIAGLSKIFTFIADLRPYPRIAAPAPDAGYGHSRNAEKNLSMAARSPNASSQEL